MLKSRFASLASVALLTGCGSFVQLQPNEAGPAADESVVVIGIKPHSARITFVPGSKEANGFKVGSLASGLINDNPTNGYIVAKGKAGQTLALTRISYGPVYEACGNTRTAVFDVPAGKVVYLA